MTEKISAYLGFCQRAGKILFGVDDIQLYKKKIHLLLADEGLAENSFKKLLQANERFAAPLLVVEKGLLGEMLHRPAVKAAGIRDFQLAKAILQAAKEQTQFKLSSGGNNSTYGTEKL